jgi:predicted aminopeptidase
LGNVARVLGVRRRPKTRLASDDPAGEVFAERLAGHRAGSAFLALRVELPHNLSSRSAADIDALLATVWEVNQNGSAEPPIRGFVDGPLAG